MTLKDSINRTLNLLGVSIVALAGFAFLPEVIIENDFPDKIDDGLLFVIGLTAIGWYLTGKNKFKRSVMPVVFVFLSLATKILAVIIEHDDKEAIGDDFGALILFILAAILVSYLYIKSKKLLSEADGN
jgi:hypothetical protein